MVLTQDKVNKIYQRHIEHQDKRWWSPCARVTIHNRLRKWRELDKAIKISRWWRRCKVISSITRVSQFLKKSMHIRDDWFVYKYCNIYDELWYIFKRIDECKPYEEYRTFSTSRLMKIYKENNLEDYVNTYGRKKGKDEKKTNAG